MLKLRFDIENKILVPFVLLLILSIVTLGAVSYWNGYQMLLENEKQNLIRHLENMEVYLEGLSQQVATGSMDMETARQTAIKYFQEIDRNNGFIMTGGDTLLVNHYRPEESWGEALAAYGTDPTVNSLQLGRDIFVFQRYEPWGWVLGYGMNRQMFTQEVLETQKYMILLAIVSLVVSMQAAIIIAYHISRPIKQLAEVFGRIGQGNLNETVALNRHDEIGQLADAFNEMMEKLKMNTAKLLEMTRLNEDILRNITTGILTTDHQGNLVSVNPAAREMLDHRQEPMGDGVLEGILKAQIHQTLITGEGQNEVCVIGEEEGEALRYLDLMTSLLRNETAETVGVICSFRDITERKRIENNMETLDRLTSMGQMAAGMAHEIRNPLAGMKTSLQVLQRRVIQGPADPNDRLFQNTLYEIDRINQLITELLHFARPRRPVYEPVALEKVLHRSLELTGKALEEKLIRVTLQQQTDSTRVFVDQGQLEQVFLNLIHNALKAMSREGSLQLTIGEERNRLPADDVTAIWVEIQDDGVGIDSEYLEKVFDPFFTTDPQGVGLGLSVVHELVKENRGKITVTSRQHAGTTFRVSFPVHPPESPERPAREEGPYKPEIAEVAEASEVSDGYGKATTILVEGVRKP
ncbi:sensor histidine kinase [Anoxynatronum buryatiense]|uniref:histidine kinase n=1 Tax=Anoxynatronum buryatiense TaxID=489973 RepID=A0AA45WVF5_9CLOT|nr:ATP-binding protein [Anoxynatronum buryatiense]SMP53643.1 PAS domain S-box-containing protein [Anoxynatronum buryatiense]